MIKLGLCLLMALVLQLLPEGEQFLIFTSHILHRCLCLLVESRSECSGPGSLRNNGSGGWALADGSQHSHSDLTVGLLFQRIYISDSSVNSSPASACPVQVPS